MEKNCFEDRKNSEENKMNASIIIPAFNAEKTIQKTINSLLIQTVKPKEIIVVNDGSTDKTKSITEKLSEKNHLIKIFTRKNSGISASRNFGAKKAKEELIIFLDSDVFVEKEWLEKLLIPLKKPEVFGVCGKYSSELNKSLGSDFFSYIISSSSFQGYNIAFKKKDFLELNGFNEKMKYCEDPEFFLRVFLKGKKLTKTKAESFHNSYSLKERIKSNFNYSFFDAVVFKKYFSFLLNPINLIKAPENIKMIFLFYWIVFFSIVFSFTFFLITQNIYSFIFLLLPAYLGTMKILLQKNTCRHKNNFLLVLIYSFFAISLFTAVKTAGFIFGLIQNKV